MISGFEAVWDKDIEYLILGSMPGVASLDKREYYGHKNNQFWKIMKIVTGANGSDAYEDRITMLKNSRIGLWDVIGTCSRVGSRDDKIKEISVNDINNFLKKCKKVKVIFLNGRKAESIFKKHFEDMEINSVYLPSTSPLNTMKLTKKTLIWKKAFKKYGFNNK